MPLLTLASASPRRQELIRLLGIPFQTVPSLVDEAAMGLPPGQPAATTRVLAMAKAEEVAERVRDGLILGADTVVALEHQIFGKPKDVTDAAEMLHRLRGRTHHVYTGIALLHCRDGVIVGRSEDHVETAVRMKTFSLETLHAYLDTGEPMDKAGAYAIQGRGALLIEGIAGDYSNVVGLPISRVADMLEVYGVRCL